MAIINNQIRISSNPKSRFNLPWQSIGQDAALIKMGWTRPMLIRLTHRLQSVLINFERITQSSLRFKVILDHQSPQDEVFAVNKKSREIYVYLKHDLEDVLEYTPLGISRELTELFFDTEIKAREFMIASVRSHILEHGYIGQAAKSVTHFFNTERGINLNEIVIARTLARLTGKGCQNIARTKMGFILLQPYPVPLHYFEKIIQINLEELSDAAGERNIETHVWEIVATLAALSVLAKKAGSIKFENICQSLLHGEMVRELAQDELMILELDNSYSHLTSPQEERVRKGFDLIFGIFRTIFEYYYDELEIDRIRKEPYL